MTPEHIRDLAQQHWILGPWWEREAALALEEGRAFVIPTRDGSSVYLVRFWLCTPLRGEDISEGRFESGNALLLHFFARGDDDESLHDHPWDFRTSILKGGYVEHLPPHGWVPGSALGPEWDARRVGHYAGADIMHRAEDLHCVGFVMPDTWTLLRTGPRRRPWGFHPPGDRWVPYREYLDRRRAIAKAVIG